jgi:geranyl diphosphate 2-C-methyltransferase
MNAVDDRRATDLVELVDDLGNPVGTTDVIDAHRNGRKHRAFSVLLFDGRGNVLIQQRALDKSRFAGVWGPSCCGHPRPGQDLVAEARQHVWEELRVTGVEPFDVGHISYTLPDPHSEFVEKEFDHILIAFHHGDPDPDPAEVAAVRWVNVDQLAAELAAPPPGVEYGEWLKAAVEVAVPAARAEGLLYLDVPDANDDHQKDVYAYYRFKSRDTINTEAGPDDYVHSHFAVIPYNPAVLGIADEALREKAILREIHRMENHQCTALLDLCPPLPPTARIVDAACGRGGTSFHAWERFGCTVHGVDFADNRIEFARNVAKERGIDDQVQFFVANVENTGLAEHSYDAVIFNEAAVHMPSLHALLRETARLLKPGGVLVFVEWIADSVASKTSPSVRAINRNYYTRLPARSEILADMLANRLVPRHIEDRRDQVLPYWELRRRSAHRTGVEDPFTEAFTTGTMNYFMCVAEYQPDEGPG